MRILIVQTAFIGDVILITPLIRETRKVFPEAKIDVLVSQGNQSILANNPHLNNIYSSNKTNIKDYFYTLFKLRKNHYDLALTPHRSARTISLLYLSGIKYRAGFNRDIYKHLLNIRLRHPKNVHKARKNLELLAPFLTDKFPDLRTSSKYRTVSELDWSSELFPNSNDVKVADKYLSENNIALAPGSVWNTKRWSTENYVILTKILADKGFNLVFIGSKGERELAQNIIDKAGINAVNTCGKMSILQSASLISKCLALICNDSGSLHIGNAVKTQIFAFFGPTVKKFGYYPFRENDLLFEIDLPCRPCGMHGHKDCPLGHHNCMKLIDAHKVAEDIMEKLESKDIASLLKNK